MIYKGMTSLMKKRFTFLVFLLTLVLGVLNFTFLYYTKNLNEETLNTNQSAQNKTKGMMILIEYKDTIGLTNFVNEMQKRQISGVLHVSADFVEENCDTIKELLKYNVEIMASVDEVLWDVPFDEQKELISDSKNRIEVCTGKSVKIISSPYMASDINTLKVADELGIPYVTARGTTGLKASVYQVEGYNAKILSVSNIPNVKFEYGSLCDYSFFQRSGTPDDMLDELMWAIEPLTEKEKAAYGQYNKVTPVTHTNIGGYLKPWTTMWINFWDETEGEVDWVNLDDFMSQADWTFPDWQVPINKNAPYTPEKIRPITSYEDTEKVLNPCAVEEIKSESADENIQTDTQNKIVAFHNGQGPMCLAFLEFVKDTDFTLEEHLTVDNDFYSQLETYKAKFSKSEGVSESFGYYPILFVNDKAYSGFSEEIRKEIENQL